MDLGREWTLRALWEEAVRVLEVHQVPEAPRNVEWLLEEVMQCSRAQLFAYPERRAEREAVQVLDRMLARRLQREPLQYILGYTEFYGLRIQVTSAVLIPRPETEQVVAAALEWLSRVPSPRVLDLGTGSGCIALVLKHERPDAEVYACDVSREALAVAQANADALGLSVTFVEADLLSKDFYSHVSGPFDLIISNPPYVPPTEAASLAEEVRMFEPHLALFSNDDPLQFYRAIVAHGERLLAPGGLMALEGHANHAPSVGNLLAEAGYREVDVRHDLGGFPRILLARRPTSS